MSRLYGRSVAVLVLVLLIAAGVCAAQDRQNTDVDRMVLKLEGQDIEIILTLPQGFCGISWGTAPENTGLHQTLQREDRVASGQVYSAEYSAEVKAEALLGDSVQDKPAAVYYHYDKRTDVLGLSLVALSFAGEDTVKKLETVLVQKYGKPSAVQEVHQDCEIRWEYCWYGKNTSIRFAPANDWSKATVVVFATKNLDI